MSEEKEEFVRANYKEGPTDGTTLEIWIGNQGFALTEKFKDNPFTSQEKAEWYFKMFEKALDSHFKHQLSKLIEEFDDDKLEEMRNEELPKNLTKIVYGAVSEGFYGGVNSILKALKDKL